MSAIFPVTEDERWREHTASAGQTVFPVPYPFQDNADIKVVRINLDGSETTLAEPAHYTLTGAGNPAGGQYVLTTPATAGQRFRSIGEAVATRTTSIVRDGRYSSSAIDADLDRALIHDLENKRDIARAWKSEFGVSGGQIAAGADGTVAMFDVGGNLVEGPSGDQISAAQGFADAAAASEAAAAATAAEFRSHYLGAYADDAGAEAYVTAEGITKTNNVSRYFNTTYEEDRIWDGVAWVGVVLAGEDGISFIWRGAYSGATSYAKDDVVRHGDSTWIALQATTGNAPPNLPTTSNAYWELMSARGADGTGVGDMLAANNLSEISDVGEARDNLSVYSKAQTDAALVTKADAAATTAALATKPTLSSGVVQDGNYSARLRAACQGITDWNAVTTNGWFMTDSGVAATANTPPGTTGWVYGRSTVHNSNYLELIVTIMTGANVGQTWRKVKSGGTWGSWERLYWTAGDLAALMPYAVLEDQKASGTAGQSITANVWTTLNLTTEVHDPNSIVTLTSNQFVTTVPCWCEWEAAGKEVAKSRLWNVTDGVAVAMGQNVFHSYGGVQFSNGGAAIVAGKTYRIETNSSQAGAIGNAQSKGTEVYSRVRLRGL